MTTRRRIIAALHSGPQTARQLAERTGIPLHRLKPLLSRLRGIGAVLHERGKGKSEGVWRSKEETP